MKIIFSKCCLKESACILLFFLALVFFLVQGIETLSKSRKRKIINTHLNNTVFQIAQFFGFLTLEDGIDRLSRNVCKELPLQLRNKPEERSSQITQLFPSKLACMYYSN
jgi:hypothetical protein